MALSYDEAVSKIKKYEENGAAKLYYSLNRKMWEMAEILNKNEMSGINLDDPKDKTFDRMFKILEKSEPIATAAKALRDFAGITGNEDIDVAKKPFVDLLAENRK